MYKNKNLKRILALFVCIIPMLFVTGCEIIPTLKLTDSEAKIIAEYAAGLLLKYDRNYQGNLSEFEEEEEDTGLNVVDDYNKPPAEDEASQDETGDGSSDKKDKSGATEYLDAPMSEALGLDGFDVSYTGMEAHQIYPEEEPEEMVFSMQSQQGMELLVLNFNVTNTSDSERLCDVLQSGATFRAILNGSERVNSQRTILLNDLSQYHENISGYGMVDTVLIFEIEEGATQSLSSLDLIIKSDGGSFTYKIM